MTTVITKEQEVVKRKTTLVRRVSDLFKDEMKLGHPSLFRHGSMQALRYCCQNLNLFPYLLHSFARNTKEHSTSTKINASLGLLFARITERIFRVYAIIPQTIISFGVGFQSANHENFAFGTNLTSLKPSNVDIAKNVREKELRIVEKTTKFEKFEKRKPKRNPWFLILAVYSAPMVLALQIVGVSSLIVFGKYTPGFVFLVSALFFLGYISMKVLNHDNESVHTYKREKRKIE